MPFAYYARLSAVDQRTYRASDAIERLDLPAGFSEGAAADEIAAALAGDDRAACERACQRLTDALARGYAVPPIRVKVLAKRPSNDYGELHGLYEPAEGRAPATVTVWMRTAQRRQVVAFRSFLRTLVHEIGHHLDYEMYEFAETFHTEGFYKRESTLANALIALMADPPPARGARTSSG
ncbi:MAG: hypothetical protein DYH14_07245 [Betaproteobacteria bacterium PRO3]|nr:hypothetical protein [Betaproteobacteria bacterium PRO3]